MAEFVTRPLTADTWAAFATLVEAHGGVYGGCWCLGFHAEGRPQTLSADERRAAKEERVRQGRAHAALVFDGEACVGWCQFGSPDELPRIKNRKQYDAAPPATPPAWRITCFFTARGHKKQGVATAALAGALEEIASLGGGTVEAYPEDISAAGAPAVALHGGTLAMFEREGFTRDRKIGKNKWVVHRSVAAR